jgi:hypothetical protein
MIRVVVLTACLWIASPTFGFVPNSIASSNTRHFPVVPLKAQDDTNVDEKTNGSSSTDEYQKMAMEISESNGSSKTKKEKENGALTPEEIVKAYKSAATNKKTAEVETKTAEVKEPTEEEIVESMTIDPTSEQAESDEEFMGMAIDEALSG